MCVRTLTSLCRRIVRLGLSPGRLRCSYIGCSKVTCSLHSARLRKDGDFQRHSEVITVTLISRSSIPVNTFYASFVREQCSAHFDLLAILRGTSQFVAIAFIASFSLRNCDLFFRTFPRQSLLSTSTTGLAGGGIEWYCACPPSGGDGPYRLISASPRSPP